MFRKVPFRRIYRAHVCGARACVHKWVQLTYWRAHCEPRFWFLIQHKKIHFTRITLVPSYVTRMCLYVTFMLIVYYSYVLVCHSYVLVYHSYVIPVYPCIIRMYSYILVCIRMLLVVFSWCFSNDPFQELYRDYRSPKFVPEQTDFIDV